MKKIFIFFSSLYSQQTESESTRTDQAALLLQCNNQLTSDMQTIFADPIQLDKLSHTLSKRWLRTRFLALTE
jgi:hypothetical protein